jgi:hypothetical protein
MGQFTIRARCDRHNEPAADTQVHIYFRDGARDSGWTDRHGCASFNLPDGNEYHADIEIRGESFRDYRCYRGRTLTFHVPCKQCRS